MTEKTHPDYWHPTPDARLETDEEYVERRRREEKEFWKRFEEIRRARAALEGK
jgi:hypothetical protein